MKSQRRFAPTGGELAPESVERFIGICTARCIHISHSNF